MSREKGPPAYPGKKIIGSTYLTPDTVDKLMKTAVETGRSKSDVIEHALRKVLPTLTRNSRLVGEPGKFGSDTEQTQRAE
jgi:hypothetical protein